MSFSPALKLFIALLLLITLGWKVAVRAVGSGERTEKDVRGAVAEFLVRQNFNVSALENIEEGRPTIAATAGGCRMLIAKSPALGWDRDMLRRYATPADRIFVVFRGQVYAEQPTWLTVPYALWSRLQRGLGLMVGEAPVLAVIATPNCDAERLPWQKLDDAKK